MKEKSGGLLHARIGFGIALAMAAAAHFLPAWRMERYTLCDLWSEFAHDVEFLLSGSYSLDRLMSSAAILCVTATMIAAPFLVRFLQGARALLWVVRLLALAFSGWFTVIIVHATRHFETQRITLLAIGPGLWLLMGAFWIFTLSMFLIRARKGGAEEPPSRCWRVHRNRRFPSPATAPGLTCPDWPRRPGPACCAGPCPLHGMPR
ncbi:hypothetical protein [Luteolibacter sp. LG18]|uniref:hypothetical protein n=1 Tax=Luteolibacter sp. LG18 TaxID=2819286 RepID=UPI002B31D03F|nr:hypothetical protein llg_42320 [Luteolibacter sp. LG18]